MIYFEKQEDGTITKWDITFDEDDLKEIREEVINNCSKITHFDKVDRLISIPEIDGVIIKNYFAEKVDYDTRFLYHITYDEYKYPRLVTLIDSLLSGDLTVINEIETPVETREYEYVNMIESLDTEIDSIDNYDVDRKIRKLEQLKKVISESESNKKENPLSKYYEITGSVINMYFVDYLESSEIERLEEFFDIDIKEVVKKKEIIK